MNTTTPLHGPKKCVCLNLVALSLAAAAPVCPGYEEFLHFLGFGHPTGDVWSGAARHHSLPIIAESRPQWLLG